MNAMSSFAWESLAGTVIPDGFVLKTLLEQTPQSALFKAHAVSESHQPEALVELIIPQEAPQTVVNRFLEASYLRHPNVAGISSAGFMQDLGLVYAVAEPVDHTLSQLATAQPLALDHVRELVNQIGSALEFLHSENLVFCNLRPESIWRTPAGWKLGDFSQLRVIGSGNSRELRSTLARRPDLPPEVYEGLVSPAWDVWSLGVLLRRILAPIVVDSVGNELTPRNRPRNSVLPAPFDAITRECLNPDPEARITLGEIRSRLHTPHPHSAVLKDGVRAFFHSLPSRPPRVKAWFAIVCAALVLAILVSANSLLRHGAPAAEVVAGTPTPIVVSEADRAVETPAPTRLPASSLPANVKRLLDTWVATAKSRDAESNADCYTPVVDVYFNKQRLSRPQLIQEKKRQFQNIGPVRKFVVDNLQFHQLGPAQAVVLFDKQWSFGDRNAFSGAERGQLTLRNVSGQWKISSERELKVYWVRKGKG